jgi:hypothetical protein
MNANNMRRIRNRRQGREQRKGAWEWRAVGTVNHGFGPEQGLEMVFTSLGGHTHQGTADGDPVKYVGAVPNGSGGIDPVVFCFWSANGEARKGANVNSTKRMFCLLATVSAIGWGCDSQNDPYASNPRGAAAPGYEVQRGGGESYRRGEQQAAFLNRIRESDPRFQTIQRAVLNENNELGLVLSRNVEMDSIPALMRTMLSEMSKEFPGQDLTVIAYAPTQPPMKIGTGRLDAGTRQMTYTRAQQGF